MKKGIVIKSTGSWYKVKSTENKIYDCKIRGKLRIKGIKSTNPVAVGDIVIFNVENDHTGIITDYEERKNYIIRKASNLSKQTHIIAANIDQAFLIVTLVQPKTTSLFIDRFLLSAESYRIQTILVFNKIDLYTEQLKNEHDEIVSIYKEIGYTCLSVSAEQNINMEKFKNLLKGNISVIAGNSGVGKSTLINKVDPTLSLKTNKISEYHKSGKHTTTFAEMFDLSFGGSIIDTPGIKGYGLRDYEKEEIYHFFPEIFNYAHNCKYHNCLHVQEPGCNVIEAVKSNKISISRYNNYLSILFNTETKYR